MTGRLPGHNVGVGAPPGRLGDAFRLRRFHDRVLSYGHMPPTLVARAIEAADEQEQHLRPDE
ncbi:MAG: hypothetical protein ACJ75E_10060 [Actinomycetes bacterium]